MKKLRAILFILFFHTTGMYAQLHPAMLSLKGIGGGGADQVYNISRNSDSSFIIAISSTSAAGTGNIGTFCNENGDRSIFLKYDATGTVLEWTNCYLNIGDSSLTYIFPTSDSGFVLGGEFNSISGLGFLIQKEDVTGNVVWSHSFSKGHNVQLFDMKATDDGGYIMLGIAFYTDTNFTVHNTSVTQLDIAVLKVDSLGNKQWSRGIGGSENESAATIVRAPHNGYYIVGSTQSSDYDCTGYHGGLGDAYLVRLDSNGNILWHNDLGGSERDGGYAGCEDGKGGIIVAATAASTDGDVQHPQGGSDYWVIDVDSSNNIVWDNCYGGSGASAIPAAICKATDGSLWLNGDSNGSGGEIDVTYDPGENGDVWLVHTDSIGDFLSEQVLSSFNRDDGTAIYPLPGGLILVGGYFGYSDGSFASLPFYSFFGSSNAFFAVFAPWTLGVPQISEPANIVKMHPNPASENVTIKWEHVQYATLVINDVTGRQMYSGNIRNGADAIIDVSSWTRGLYFVQLINDDGFRTTKKLSVQ